MAAAVLILAYNQLVVNSVFQLADMGYDTNLFVAARQKNQRTDSLI